MKVKTTLLIDEKIIEKAKDLGINLSKALEKTLQNLIEAIEKAYSTEKAENFLGEASFLKKVRAGSLVRIGRKPPKLVVVGSNPTPPAYDEHQGRWFWILVPEMSTYNLMVITFEFS